VGFVPSYKVLKDLIFSQYGISNTPLSYWDSPTCAWDYIFNDGPI